MKSILNLGFIIKLLFGRIKLMGLFIFSSKPILSTDKYNSKIYSDYISKEDYLLLKYIQPGKNILDFGSSDGRIPLKLINKLKIVPRHITFTNIFKIWARVVAKNMRNISYNGTFETLTTDITNDSKITGYFDFITAFGIFGINRKEKFERSVELASRLLNQWGILVFNLPSEDYIYKLTQDIGKTGKINNFQIQNEILINRGLFLPDGYLTSIGNFPMIDSIMAKYKFRKCQDPVKYYFDEIIAGYFFVFKKC